jgi:predicted SAM-dependent methyltransferase
MISRKAKAAFYLLAGPLMKMNAVLYRYFRAPKDGTLRVHLGPGQERYIIGWINVDANMFTAKCDVWANLEEPLPFHDATVDAIYSHHLIEHLDNVDFHFREVFRCLKPGGIYRVGCPNGDSAIQKFMERDEAWFSDFPDKRNSIGGRLENFIFCRGEHRTILTVSYLEELMSNNGFTNICTCLPIRDTKAPELFRDCLAVEYESDFDVPHTLIIEGVKAR